MNEIKDTQLIGRIGLAQDVTLIKVQVIKKKYIEQMPKVEVRDLSDDAEILGHTDYPGRWVVVNDKGRLVRVHEHKFLSYWNHVVRLDMDGTPDGSIERANRTLEALPQIFQD